MNKSEKWIKQTECARIILKKKTCSGSFTDNDVDEAPNVGQFVAVEVDQEDGGTGPAGMELDAGLGFLSGAHIADPARDVHVAWRGVGEQRWRDRRRSASALVCDGFALGEAHALDGEAAVLQQLWERVDQGQLRRQQLLHPGLPLQLQTDEILRSQAIILQHSYSEPINAEHEATNGTFSSYLATRDTCWNSSHQPSRASGHQYDFTSKALGSEVIIRTKPEKQTTARYCSSPTVCETSEHQEQRSFPEVEPDLDL